VFYTSPSTLTVLNSNFLVLHLGRRCVGRPQRTVYPSLPVNTDTHYVSRHHS